MIIDLLFHLVYLQCWEFIKPLLKFKQNYNKVSPHTRQNGHHQKVLDIITLLCLKWIANKDLLHSTWNFAQCYVAVWIGGEFGGEWIHVYMWLYTKTNITLLICDIPTQNNKKIFLSLLIINTGEWRKGTLLHYSDQIRSVTQSCPTLCNPMNRSTPGFPVHHQFPEFTQTHVHQVSDAI